MAQGRHVARLQLILLGFAFLAAVLWLNWINIRTPSLVTGVICIVGAIVLDRQFIPWIDLAKKREDDAIRGAEAEEAVGAILDRLSDNYMVLHDVRNRYGNIDHVVLKKNGAVFVIETKSTDKPVSERNGQLLFNRYAQNDFVAQTVRNAVWLRDVLAAELGVIPWVDAGLVFTRARVSVRNEREEIQVMNISSLVEWLERSPEKREVGRLAVPKWEKIRKVLRREETGSNSWPTKSRNRLSNEAMSYG